MKLGYDDHSSEGQESHNEKQEKEELMNYLQSRYGLFINAPKGVST